MTRNEEIYMAHTEGATDRELANRYGISTNCIRMICRRHKEIIERDGGELYNRLHDLVADPRVAGKIYGILARNGITTIAAVRGLTEKEMKRMRNCGEKMVEVLKGV